MKKIILITVVIAFIGIGVLLWFAFFHTSSNSISEDIRNILPFGQGGEDIGLADDDKPTEINPASGSATNLPRLLRLSDVPVSGAVSFLKNGTEVVRYTDRATGHIYDINPGTLEKTKIANITQPKIYEAYFKGDGSGVMYRTLPGEGNEIVNTYIDLVPPKSTSTDALYTEVPTILRGNIDGISVAGNRLAYVLKDAEIVVTSDFNGTNLKTVLSSPFVEWNTDWKGTSITLSTKASSAVSGYAYSLNPQTGTLSKLLGPINGLTVSVNPIGSRLIYNSSSQGAVRSFSLNTSSGESFEITPTVITDKCAWSKKNSNQVYCGSPTNPSSGGEPDLWYQGITHYSDQIWKFNVDTLFSDVVVNPSKDFNVDMDIINPFLTPDEDYLIFTNKNDLSLWALKLVD